MISFRDFGYKGSLGNQFFQLCSLVGIARTRGFEWAVPLKLTDSNEEIPVFRYFELRKFRLENAYDNSSLGNRRHLSKPNRFLDTTGVRFDAKLKHGVPDDVDLSAYLQSYKYFDELASEIKSEFSVKEKYRKIPAAGSEYISLHVRRGDYLNHPATHRVLPISYYMNALKNLPDLPIKIVVAPQDKMWVEDSPLSSVKSAEISSGTEIDDWQVLANSRFAIIANSTFSYSAAYCSTSVRTVIAPKVWFGWSYSKSQSMDICPPNWLQI